MPATIAFNPLQSFALKLESFAQSVKDEILAFAAAFLPQVEHDAEIALDDLVAIAMNSVIEQADTMLSGREKFGNAVDSVVQTVEAGGKTVAQQTAQMAVQQAYLTAQSIAQSAAQ